MKTNNLILQTTTKAVAFVILMFSIYLLLAGHNRPGGGFIGGLMTAAAIVLLYLAYDFETISQLVPLNFRLVLAAGVLIAALTGIASLLFGGSFLDQAFGFYDLPLLGEVELTTALIFDIGVYLTVIGAAITAVSTIREDS